MCCRACIPLGAVGCSPTVVKTQSLVEHYGAHDMRHRPAAVQRPLVRILALHVPIVERMAQEALYVPRHQLLLVGEVRAIGALLEPRQ